MLGLRLRATLLAAIEYNSMVARWGGCDSDSRLADYETADTFTATASNNSGTSDSSPASSPVTPTSTPTVTPTPTPNPQETVPGKLKVKNNNYAKTWKKLKPGKRYVVKVRAENSVGSGKAKQRQFTTNKRTANLPANG